MIPINQTELFAPDHPFVGNSLQACLASILEKNIEEIPPFGADISFDWDGWKVFLKDNGIVSCIMPLNPTYLKVNEEKVAGHLIGYKLVEHDGKEKRSAIIMDGGQIVHDPYPTDEPVKKLIGSVLFVGCLI